jgi:tetratricopeptide (TPR) repeat protein
MHYFMVPMIFWIVLFTNPASATKWTAAELAAMPAYCAGRYARTTNHAEYRHWELQYGPDFIHTHHLCDGIGLINKYPRATSNVEKREMMKAIMGNLNYMIQNAKTDFKLMPDVYYYRSQAHQLSGKTGEATRDLRKAIELNPAYVPAYTLLADYLQRQGQQQEALRIVSDGLRHKPDSVSLQRLYARLSGDTQGITTANSLPSPIQESVAPQEKVHTDESRVKRVVFDFGRPLSTGVNALREAGAYVFVEFKEVSPGEQGRVLMTIASHIPQPAARVVRLGIDMGKYKDMFVSVKVLDPVQSKYYLVSQAAASESHAFWPKFNPLYSIKFTRARNEKRYDLYDPRALPPGKSLPVEVILAPGYQIDDLVDAVKKGLGNSDGIRLAIIVNHTKGYRPDPRKTIMDDGGYVTGSLRQVDGFDKPQSVSTDTNPMGGIAPTTPGNNDSTDPMIASQADLSEDVHTTKGKESGPVATPPPIGSAKNPWCRFCPTE